jgi:alcohol dehydrogenase YqhD (iron-dependent ADH family)
MNLREELQSIESEYAKEQQEYTRVKQILVQHETNLVKLTGAYERIKGLLEKQEKEESKSTS